MELHDLVALRNQLEPLTANTAKIFADRQLNKIVYWVNEAHEFSANTQIVLDQINNLSQHFQDIDKNLSDLKQNLNTAIQNSERKMYLDSYKNYKMSANQESVVDLSGSKRLIVNQDDRSLYQSRLGRYSQWQYPGMIIRPGRESFIDLMVSFQPLYLVDHSQYLIDMATDKFNDLYKQRLRQYVIKDFSTTPALDLLPSNQFGLILAYGYFNWRPMELIVDYLEQIHDKLRAGGSVIFTFNNCDYPEAVKLAANQGASYVPGRALKEAIISLDYEIEYEYTNQAAVTWLELKKPGKLSSIKAAPTLAKIIDLPK